MPVLLFLLFCSLPLHAIEVQISSRALENTLQQQLFQGGNGRVYLRGNADHGCALYAENPKISFANNRIVVNITINGVLGKMLFGKCVGVPIHTSPEVSLVPVAHGEVVGFEDARIDRVTENSELNALAMPFLKRQLPRSMEINVSDQLRKLLSDQTKISGYQFTLHNLNLVTLAVQGDHLYLNVEAKIQVE
jgi:hypothetical protein